MDEKSSRNSRAYHYCFRLWPLTKFINKELYNHYAQNMSILRALHSTVLKRENALYDVAKKKKKKSWAYFI